MPETILRELKNSAHSTSSLTAFALAPGVLNTTMPCSLQRFKGILLTPAPARAIANRFSGSSASSILAERTKIASGFSTASPHT